LIEYNEVKLFYEDIVEWKSVTMKVLSEWKNKEYNYEFVRAHISDGKDLEIESVEMEILGKIVNLCAHWKSIAR
jgi:hypothetical protein